MATVQELIRFLQKQPGDLQVAYQRYSEQCLLKIEDITVDEFCYPRPDGWIQNKRPTGEPTQKYLLFPGN